MILTILIALLSILTVFYFGYIVLKKINTSENNVYDSIILECTNLDCERKGQKEYRYKVSKDSVIEILPCPICGQGRQVIKNE